MPLLLIGVLGGTLLATALKALFDIGSTVAQNKYNSPLAQKNRLQKAKLPLAYMYQGKVATQASAPQLSIDPNLGTIGKQQVKNLKLQEEDLAKDIQVKDMFSGIKDAAGNELNNRAALKAAEAFIKSNEAKIKNIEFQVEDKAFAEGITVEKRRQELEKIKQQVQNLLAQAGLMGQLKKIRGFEEMLNSALTEDIKSLPDWVEGFLKIIMLATRR